MAITSNSFVQFEYNLTGGPAPIMTFYESSGLTFKPGAAVSLTTGGLTCVASGDAAAVLGFALSCAHADSTLNNSKMQVVLATPMTVFSGCVDHATTASAHPAHNQIGKTYPLKSDCANGQYPWYVDIDGTTATAGAWVIGMKDSTSTQYGRVYFIVRNIAQGPWSTAGTS